MKLSPMTHKEHLGPFLLGTYEAQLHPWLESTVRRPFTQILDVGAKFGYYAIGLSRLQPGVPVIAFDTDWWARAATREMASANRTAEVSVSGYCSPRWLDQNLRPGSFILTDCEGYEAELFSRTTTPAIDSAVLLIEIHDDLVPGVGTTVRNRFARTHTVEVALSEESRRPAEDLSFLNADEATKAVCEHRLPQQWFLMRPNSS